MKNMKKFTLNLVMQDHKEWDWKTTNTIKNKMQEAHLKQLKKLKQLATIEKSYKMTTMSPVALANNLDRKDNMGKLKKAQ